MSEWIEELSQLSPGMRAAYLDQQHDDLPTVVCGDLALVFAREFPSLPSSVVTDVFSEVERLANLPEPISTAALTGFVECLVHLDACGDFDFRPCAHLVGRTCRDHIHRYDHWAGTTTRGFERGQQ